ncbi:MAG: hypothetical protein HC836_40905 [Richelia sp. RM2_1_2]|nr:hypothetical protein [Richelia sp. RM2_1_2]
MTYTIEDLLEELEEINHYQVRAISFGSVKYVNSVVTSPADRKFISDLCQRTKTGGNFSTKQAEIAKKIIRKYASAFSQKRESNYAPQKTYIMLTELEVHAVCDRSLFRIEPYISSNVPRIVRYLGHRKLGFQSKYSPQVIEKIKSLGDPINPSKKSGFPYFNKKHKIWVVEVTENNLEKVMKVIKKFNFEFDEDTVQFLTDCTNSTTMQSTAEVKDNMIYITSQNNDLLARWVENILSIEELMNV